MPSVEEQTTLTGAHIVWLPNRWLLRDCFKSSGGCRLFQVPRLRTFVGEARSWVSDVTIPPIGKIVRLVNCRAVKTPVVAWSLLYTVESGLVLFRSITPEIEGGHHYSTVRSLIFDITMTVNAGTCTQGESPNQKGSF